MPAMIVRIPILRLAVGFHTYTLIHRRVAYGDEQIVERFEEEGLTVVRAVSRGKFFGDVRYSLVDDAGRILCFIRGYAKSRRHFYIERIAGEEKRNIFQMFRLLGKAVERDIRARGFEQATALTSVRLAPLIVRRFGFHVVRGIKLAALVKGWRKHIPWKMILLRKY